MTDDKSYEPVLDKLINNKGLNLETVAFKLIVIQRLWVDVFEDFEDDCKDFTKNSQWMTNELKQNN